MPDNTKVKPKNVGKVAKVLIKNPHATQREIAKATGLAQNTVIKAEKELKQNGGKDANIQFIIDSSKETLKLAKQLQKRFINQIKKGKKIDRNDMREISNIAKDDMQRITVLGGNVTDDKGGLIVETISYNDIDDED